MGFMHQQLIEVLSYAMVLTVRKNLAVCVVYQLIIIPVDTHVYFPCVVLCWCRAITSSPLELQAQTPL